MIEQSRFGPSLPELIPVGENKWEIQWSRSSETAFLQSLDLDNPESPTIVLIKNVDDANQVHLTKAASLASRRETVSGYNISTSLDFWQIIIATYSNRYNTIPLNLAVALMNATVHSFNHGRIMEGPIQAIANSSLKLYSSDSKATVGVIIEDSGIAILCPEQVKNTTVLSIEGNGDPVFQRAIGLDYYNDAQFRSFINRSVFILRGAYPSFEATATGIPLKLIRIIALCESRLSPPSAVISASGIHILSASVMEVDDAASLIRPIWADTKVNPKLDAFVKLIVEERARSVSAYNDYLVLGELALIKIVETIRQAIEQSDNLESLKPRTSPVDAKVINGQLVLVDQGQPTSEVAIEALNELRLEYYLNCSRLADSLAGTNAGEAFITRIQATKRTLSKELTYSSCILLGDQARALELMFPAISEVLTDVTASDIGAFVAGFGLLVRQFPAWREFVREARERSPLTESDEKALTQVAEAIEAAAEEIVEQPLKIAVANTRIARSGLTDTILDLALVRALGNLYRAVGKVMLERRKGITAEFGKAIDKKVAEALLDTLVKGTVIAVAAQLLHLAVALPLDFGWLVGLGILLIKGPN